MTPEDVASELEREPFRPLRIHLVSGKTVDIERTGRAFMLRNAVIVFHQGQNDPDLTPYDTIALRNIERIEQLTSASGETNAT